MKRGISACAFGTNLPEQEVLEFAREQGIEFLERLVSAVAKWLGPLEDVPVGERR